MAGKIKALVLYFNNLKRWIGWNYIIEKINERYYNGCKQSMVGNELI
jgi:hypothetical protein